MIPRQLNPLLQVQHPWQLMLGLLLENPIPARAFSHLPLNPITSSTPVTKHETQHHLHIPIAAEAALIGELEDVLYRLMAQPCALYSMIGVQQRSQQRDKSSDLIYDSCGAVKPAVCANALGRAAGCWSG